MTRKEFFTHVKEGIVKGFSWSIGVTLGFAFVSTVIVFILGQAGGLPLIGHWIANIVQATQSSLGSRTPLPVN